MSRKGHQSCQRLIVHSRRRTVQPSLTMPTRSTRPKRWTDMTGDTLAALGKPKSANFLGPYPRSSSDLDVAPRSRAETIASSSAIDLYL